MKFYYAHYLCYLCRTIRNNAFMKKLMILAAVLMTVAACGGRQKATSEEAEGFPIINQGGKIAIVAHRGFWNCDEAGYSENSIAALKASQDYGFWGCEVDVHLTRDGVVLVNHNNDIAGKTIYEYDLADFAEDLLPNGEQRPTFDQFLDQAEKCDKTKLIIEIKAQQDEEHNALLTDKVFNILKAHDLFTPERVAFISFRMDVCEKIAAEAPQFINQYLTGNATPDSLSTKGINGLDYHYTTFAANQEWVEQARELGMSSNAWTVDNAENIQEMIDLDVDAITTNQPLLVRELLGEREYKN